LVNKKSIKVGAPAEPKKAPVAADKGPKNQIPLGDDLVARITARRAAIEQDMPAEDKKDWESNDKPVELQSMPALLHQKKVLSKRLEIAEETYQTTEHPLKEETTKRLSKFCAADQLLKDELEKLSLEASIAELTLAIISAKETLSQAPIKPVAPLAPKTEPEPTHKSAPFAIKIEQFLQYDTQIKTILERDDFYLTIYLKEALQDVKFVRAMQGLSEKQIAKLTKPVVIDLLTLLQWTKNKLNNVKDQDVSSINSFYTEALGIRLSDSKPGMQKILLKDLAHKHFNLGQTNLRLFADVMMMISGLLLFLPPLIIGCTRRALGHSFFFSTATSQNEKDFHGLLKTRPLEDNSEEPLLDLPQKETTPSYR
jgi:hypothetical protein